MYTYILHLWGLTNFARHNNFDVELKCWLLYKLRTVQFMRNTLLEIGLFFWLHLVPVNGLCITYIRPICQESSSVKCARRKYFYQAVEYQHWGAPNPRLHVMSCHVFTFKTRAWWGDTVVATFLQGTFGKQRCCRLIMQTVEWLTRVRTEDKNGTQSNNSIAYPWGQNVLQMTHG